MTLKTVQQIKKLIPVRRQSNRPNCFEARTLSAVLLTLLPNISVVAVTRYPLQGASEQESDCDTHRVPR